MPHYRNHSDWRGNRPKNLEPACQENKGCRRARQKARHWMIGEGSEEEAEEEAEEGAGYAYASSRRTLALASEVFLGCWGWAVLLCVSSLAKCALESVVCTETDLSIDRGGQPKTLTYAAQVVRLPHVVVMPHGLDDLCETYWPQRKQHC
jgi:hypothetical protein